MIDVTLYCITGANFRRHLFCLIMKPLAGICRVPFAKKYLERNDSTSQTSKAPVPVTRTNSAVRMDSKSILDLRDVEESRV